MIGTHSSLNCTGVRQEIILMRSYVVNCLFGVQMAVDVLCYVNGVYIVVNSYMYGCSSFDFYLGSFAAVFLHP